MSTPHSGRLIDRPVHEEDNIKFGGTRMRMLPMRVERSSRESVHPEAVERVIRCPESSTW